MAELGVHGVDKNCCKNVIILQLTHGNDVMVQVSHLGESVAEGCIISKLAFKSFYK